MSDRPDPRNRYHLQLSAFASSRSGGPVGASWPWPRASSSATLRPATPEWGCWWETEPGHPDGAAGRPLPELRHLRDQPRPLRDPAREGAVEAPASGRGDPLHRPWPRLQLAPALQRRPGAAGHGDPAPHVGVDDRDHAGGHWTRSTSTDDPALGHGAVSHRSVAWLLVVA